MAQADTLGRLVGPFFLGICFASFGGLGSTWCLADGRNRDRCCFGSEICSSRSVEQVDEGHGVLCLVCQSRSDGSRHCQGLACGSRLISPLTSHQMFAASFLSIQGFLTPHASFFISPFFGLFPTSLTQLFLLRRSHRFLTSLQFLFPTLAHPLTRTALATTITLGILLSFGTGTGASWEVYRIGNLAKLGQEWPESKPFHKLSRIWLFASSIVDVCLAVVLCWELWWAREKLTARDDGLGELNRGKGSNGILLRLIVSLFTPFCP